MAKEYKNVFMPHAMKNGVVLKNRICFSNGLQSFSVAPTKAPDELLQTDLAVFARAGASLMSFGHYGAFGGGAAGRPERKLDVKAIRARGERAVVESKFNFPGAAAEYDYGNDKTWSVIAQMAQSAHLFDTKVLVKLGVPFPGGKTLNGMTEAEEFQVFPIPKDDPRFAIPDWPEADSALAEYCRIFAVLGPEGDPDPIEVMRRRAATKEEILEAIEDVADVCLKYKNVGVDGMSLRGDRWGVNASSNIRDDEYNGEIEARGLFQYQLYKRIKEVCGDEFIIEVVMPGDSTHGHDGQLPHGYTEEEFIRFMKLVEPYIDMVEVREATGIGYQCLGHYTDLHVHPTLEIARHLREAGFAKTVAVNGGYNDPEEMEDILAEGVVDLISTVRTFRAEPDFMRKLLSGGKEVPTPCLRCDKCHGSQNGLSSCSVNPKNAMHHKLPALIQEPDRSKKVAIIGGGLIGMRTACFAAERGHSVTIFEKESFLGGKAAYYAPMYKGLWPINRYMGWLIDELGRRGITDVRLGCAPTPEDIATEGFDAVIACTGSREMRPPIEGSNQANVWTDEDIYMGNVVPGQNVVIVGGGDVATETAMQLAGEGRNVTVITRQSILMEKEDHAHGPLMANTIYIPELGYGGLTSLWTRYETLTPVYRATTTKITPDSVTYVQNGEEKTIKADTVIVSGGYKPCAEEALKYAGSAREFYMAGDCRSDCGNLLLGNRSAYGRAIML